VSRLGDIGGVSVASHGIAPVNDAIAAVLTFSSLNAKFMQRDRKIAESVSPQRNNPDGLFQ
jgi:hypothetical protein